MGRLPLDDAFKKKINKRRRLILKKIPKHYMPVINHLLPGKYTTNQIRDFIMGKTYSKAIIEDLEILFKK